MTKFLNNADVKGYVAQTAVTSSLLKTDSNGKLVAAVADTDYATPGALATSDKMVTLGRNSTGATLYQGTIVYISGSTGNVPNFVKAQADNEPHSSQTFGVVLADIPNNSNGNVVTMGTISNLDTRTNATNPFTDVTLADGDTIYLHPTIAGYVTNVKPSAPNHLVYVGKVVRTSPTNGTIVYRIQNGYELDELHNVAISSLANNQTIVWESATSLWKNKTIAAALGYTPADDSAVVKLTGDQTVAGVKTFTSVVNAPTLSLNGGVLAGNNIVSMRSNPTGGQFRIEKSDGSLSAYPFYIGVDGTALAYYYNAAGALKVLLHTNDTSYFGNSLSIGYSTYASTSYMLDVNGTVRLVGALTGAGATFSGNISTPRILIPNSTYTRALYTDSSGYLIFTNEVNSAPHMILNTNGQLTLGNTNQVGLYNLYAGAATFSNSVTATQLYAASSTHGYLNLTAVNTGGNEAGIFFAINGNKWEQYTAANDLAMNWYSYSAASIVMKLSQAGQLRLNTYTSATSFSGTAAGYLAFDSSGNVITVAGVAATDNTKLPLTGGSLTGRLNLLNTDSVDFALYHGAAASGSARIYYNQPANQLRIYATAITSDATIGIGSLALYNGSAYKIVLTEANVGSYALPLAGGTMTGTPVFTAAWGNAGGDYTGITTPAYKVDVASGYWRVVYKGAHATVSGVYNFETGKNVYWGEPTDTGDYIFRGKTLKWANSAGTEYVVIHAGNIGSQSVNYASTAGSADNIDGTSFVNTGAGGGQNADSIASNGISYVSAAISLLGQTDGALYSQAYNVNWQHQIYGDYRTGQLVVRGKNSGTWQSWRTVLDSSNSPGVSGAKYQLNNEWLRVNSDDRQFQIYGNSRTLIYRTDGNSNSHGGGGYAHIFYYGGSADTDRKFIINTDGRLYSPYHGWLDTMSVSYASSAGSLSNMNISQFTNNSGYITSSGNTSGYAGYLPTAYAGGVQSNPQVYFDYSIGLKVAMTGHWSVWSDTMWVNGYSGSDVPWMCALHFLRNSEPRFAISAQQRSSGSYGSIYEVITSYNIASQTVANLSGFDKTNPSFGAVYASNWFRAQGDCGLYSQDYGGHIRRALTGSYGNWETFGYNRNGWSGFLNLNNYNLNLMMNSSGDHGFYMENGSGWTFFFNRGNHCAGIGTDNTWSGDGLRVVKQISAEYGFTTWSDRRAKENITNITSALDKVLQMRGVYFNYIKDNAKVKRVGFIAQELQLVLPEVVNYAEEIDEYNVNYGQVVSVLTEATKEQNDMIVSQAARIEQLELLVQQLINSNNGISN